MLIIPRFSAEASLQNSVTESMMTLHQITDCGNCISPAQFGPSELQDCYIECLQDCYVDVSLRVSAKNRGPYLKACRDRCRSDCFDPSHYASGGGGGGGGFRGRNTGWRPTMLVDGMEVG